MKIKWWFAALAFYTELVLACPIFPLELLRRPFLKGPMALETTAGENQFAGRTSLASGTAFATISTAIVNSDSLIQATFQVNTTTASGVAFAAMGVNSIVSGVSFTFGSVDGVGRAPGGVIMWEIRRTS